MDYTPEEKETIVHYDYLDKCWTIQTNCRQHITRIEKTMDLYELISEEYGKNGFRSYIHVRVKDEGASVSPFARKKRTLSEEHKNKMLGNRR